jgi:SAM-dependent methyltransferase
VNSDGGSICFDRAASFYDKTRALDPEAMATLHQQLLDEVRDLRCLEIGVGTGRVALPLHDDGVDLTGIDISREMLGRLIANAGGTLPFPLLLADATQIPFKDGSFGAAYASWVFHLITRWRDVAAELLRVVEPGGKIIVAAGSWNKSLSNLVRERFRDEAGITDWPRGPKSWEELDAEMERLGATTRSLPGVPDRIRSTLEEDIRSLEEGIYSVTWGVDEAKRREAADAVRGWAEATFGSLTEERVFDHTHEWRVYELS